MNAIKKETTDWTLDELKATPQAVRELWALARGMQLGAEAKAQNASLSRRFRSLVSEFGSTFRDVTKNWEDAAAMAASFGIGINAGYHMGE